MFKKVSTINRNVSPKRPKLSLKSDKNGVKIDAEIDVGKKVEKWRPRPIELDPIFDQNR